MYLRTNEGLGGDGERLQGLVYCVTRLVGVDHFHEQRALEIHHNVVLGERLLLRHSSSALAQVAAVADFLDAGLGPVSGSG